MGQRTACGLDVKKVLVGCVGYRIGLMRLQGGHQIEDLS